MSDTDKRAAANALEEELGFRVLDDEDYSSPRFHNALATDPAGYWLVLNSQDDDRLQQPIRRGQWPGATEIIIKQLWSRCVAVAAEKAKHDAKHREIHNKLSVAAGGIVIGSFAVPMLLTALRLLNAHQIDRLWHYGTYLAAAGMGAVIAGWRTSD